MAAILAFVLLVALSQAQARSHVSCAFQKPVGSSPSETKRTMCGYTRGWEEMQRANWNVVDKSRDGKIKDGSTENGFFAYFLSGRRPIGYVSRFISPTQAFDDDSCVSFYYVNKGPKASYPKGRSMLQVYMMSDKKMPGKTDMPLWTSTGRTGGKKWKKAEVELFPHKSDGNKIHGRLIFVALRGKSNRSYLAIDDIQINPCNADYEAEYDDDVDFDVKTYVIDEPAMRLEPELQTEVLSSPSYFFRQLAAHRPVHTREFTAPPGGLLDAESPLALPPKLENARTPRRRPLRHKSRSRGHRKGKGKKRKSETFGVVYFTEEPNQAPPQGPFIPTLIAQGPPEALCGFMDYTRGLKRCLREFFSMLKQHESEDKCRVLYMTLETCLKAAATDCVPSHEMSKTDVEAVISDTLRTKFKTQQVYCEEEGAFVYPEFSLGSLPLQCDPEYFMKLTQCGGSFSGIFNTKHGDPKLCREYFTANECQRLTTAEECNFDTRTMLIYGLNLQYQFAHNPFCIDLPFSAWWPRK